MGRVLRWAAALAVVLGAAVYVAFQVSPWPAALLIRRSFDKGGLRTAAALAAHVPPGVSEQLNEHYIATDKDAYLDVYYPVEVENTERTLPAIVWVHGGGWVSGSKSHVANYARILAKAGYTVAAVDYSVAPGSIYPTPVRQVDAALAYLERHALRLHVDPSRVVLAGDSGGAHIAAQVANIVSVPSYAAAVGVMPSLTRSRLIGMLLYCGAYDLSRVSVDGPFGSFLKTVLWSYSGTKHFMNDARFASASVVDYVTAAFPPAFVSAGNADPLLPHSRALAEAIAARGGTVDTLFFPDDYTPELGHEYQFDLDRPEGQLALERSLAFLAAR